jgi:hypothetical protein
MNLVIPDCEGAELIPLDPRRVAALRHADLLVELHDLVDPTISATILSRFESTREIVVVKPEPRIESESRSFSGLGEADAPSILGEGRPDGLSWVWMRSRVSAPTRFMV